MYKMKAK